ncbi:MAG: HAMP domain-containing sensor histidine kinase [Elusimicrobiales bacterium]|nr:HAMP domain-containing sensor histidine kinase [Elusimicrobiales bacterium]
MRLFHKLSAALMAAALAAALLLSAIFFSFQNRTVRQAQEARLSALDQSVAAMLGEAELAGDPLMAVDYLSGLCSSRAEIDSCRLDIGRGMGLVKTPARRNRPGPGIRLPREIRGRKFSALINYSSEALERERRAALSGVWHDLAAAFLASMAAAALIGLLLARRLTRRLRRLAAEAAEVGEGKFGVKTDSSGSDEVAELAGALNAMSDKLLELETMKKNFTASVTHELRSPLGVIETYAALLLKEKENFRAEDLEVFRRIKENAGRLANFVTAMLDLAKIERGKMELRPAREDPLALTRDAAGFLRPKAEERGVSLSIQAEGTGSAMLDRELITHALTNLLSNAIKFTPPGGKVSVRASVSGGKYRAEVEDTGPGLKPGETEKLFAPFAQGSAAPGHGGTGLGLALAKSITELHKGTIGCSTVPGGGALFWVEIPIKVEETAT